MITGGCSSPESLRRAYLAAPGRSSLVMAASMRITPYPDASGLRLAPACFSAAVTRSASICG